MPILPDWVGPADMYDRYPYNGHDIYGTCRYCGCGIRQWRTWRDTWMTTPTHHNACANTVGYARGRVYDATRDGNMGLALYHYGVYLRAFYGTAETV